MRWLENNAMTLAAFFALPEPTRRAIIETIVQNMREAAKGKEK